MNIDELSLTKLRKLVRAYNMHTTIKGYTKMDRETLINNMKNHFEIINNFIKVSKHADLDVSNILIKKEKVKKEPKVKQIVEEDIKSKKKVKQKVEPVKQKVEEDIIPKKKIKTKVEPIKQKVEEDIKPKKKVKQKVEPVKQKVEEDIIPKKKVKTKVEPDETIKDYTLDNFINLKDKKLFTNSMDYNLGGGRLVYYLYILQKHKNDCLVIDLKEIDDEGHYIGLEWMFNFKSGEFTMNMSIDNFKKEMNKCKKNNMRFISIPLSLKPVKHYNMIIIDLKKMSLEWFEPMGDRESRYNKNTFKNLEKICNSLGLSLITSVQLCPRISKNKLKEIDINLFNTDENDKIKIGLQSMDGLSKIDNHKGFCTAWSFYYLDSRLTYPDVEPRKLQEKLFELLNYDANNFGHFIRNYAKFLIQITTKIYDDFYTKNPDLLIYRSLLWGKSGDDDDYPKIRNNLMDKYGLSTLDVFEKSRIINDKFDKYMLNLFVEVAGSNKLIIPQKDIDDFFNMKIDVKPEIEEKIELKPKKKEQIKTKVEPIKQKVEEDIKPKKKVKTKVEPDETIKDYTLDNFINLKDKKLFTNLTDYDRASGRIVYYLYILQKHKNDCVVINKKNKNARKNIEWVLLRTGEFTMNMSIDDFKKEMNKCKKNNMRFISIPLSLRGHHNMMIIDLQKMSLEWFEPHGAEFKQGKIHKNRTVKAIKNLSKICDSLGLSLITPEEICPRISKNKLKEINISRYDTDKDENDKIKIGLQSIENRVKIDDESGFCTAWSYYYLDSRLTYPDVEPRKLQEKIFELLNYDATNFAHFIRNYSKFLIQITAKIYDDFYTKNPNLQKYRFILGSKINVKRARTKNPKLKIELEKVKNEFDNYLLSLFVEVAGNNRLIIPQKDIDDFFNMKIDVKPEIEEKIELKPKKKDKISKVK